MQNIYMLRFLSKGVRWPRFSVTRVGGGTFPPHLSLGSSLCSAGITTSLSALLSFLAHTVIPPRMSTPCLLPFCSVSIRTSDLVKSTKFVEIQNITEHSLYGRWRVIPPLSWRWRCRDWELGVVVRGITEPLVKIPPFSATSFSAWNKQTN